MLKLRTPVYFGKNDRFKVYEFGKLEKERFSREWQESYNEIRPNIIEDATIFVADMENFDNYGLCEIVFQEWSKEIDNLAQVIAIVRKRYPQAFDSEYPDTIFVNPQRDSDKEYWNKE